MLSTWSQFVPRLRRCGSLAELLSEHQALLDAMWERCLLQPRALQPLRLVRELLSLSLQFRHKFAAFLAARDEYVAALSGGHATQRAAAAAFADAATSAASGAAAVAAAGGALVARDTGFTTPPRALRRIRTATPASLATDALLLLPDPGTDSDDRGDSDAESGGALNASGLSGDSALDSDYGTPSGAAAAAAAAASLRTPFSHAPGSAGEGSGPRRLLRTGSTLLHRGGQAVQDTLRREVETQAEALQEIHARFCSRRKFFLMLLAKRVQTGGAAHLADLLLRVNFNMVLLDERRVQ